MKQKRALFYVQRVFPIFFSRNQTQLARTKGRKNSPVYLLCECWAWVNKQAETSKAKGWEREEPGWPASKSVEVVGRFRLGRMAKSRPGIFILIVAAICCSDRLRWLSLSLSLFIKDFKIGEGYTWSQYLLRNWDYSNQQWTPKNASKLNKETKWEGEAQKKKLKVPYSAVFILSYRRVHILSKSVLHKMCISTNMPMYHCLPFSPLSFFQPRPAVVPHDRAPVLRAGRLQPQVRRGRGPEAHRRRQGRLRGVRALPLFPGEGGQAQGEGLKETELRRLLKN